jgi:hypothetical protein
MLDSLATRIRPFVRVLFPNHRLRAKIRAKWGIVGDSVGWLASRAFDLTRTNPNIRCVDDKTWIDLEFPRIFARLNTTISPLGAQSLYRQLRVYEYDADVLSQRRDAYAVLQTNKPLREDIQLTLSALDRHSVAYIADVLFGQPPQQLKHHQVLRAWAVFSLVALGTAIALSLLWLWIIVPIVNAIVMFATSPQMHRDSEALMACSLTLGVADRLGSIRLGNILP